jgi:CRP-like cAMP-binding protein
MTSSAAPSQAERRQLLANSFLFSQLEPSHLDEMLIAARTKRAKAREVIFHRGDEGSHVYAIVRGRLKVVVPSTDGKEMVVAILEPGEVFGEMALLEGSDRTATVTAIEDSELLVLGRREFIPILERHPKVAIRLLAALSGRLRQVNALVGDTLFLNLPARLAKKLLSLARRFGQPAGRGIRIALKLSQTDLGNLVGTSRESINKQIRQWEEEGLIRMEQGSVVIADPDQLEALSGLAEV